MQTILIILGIAGILDTILMTLYTRADVGIRVPGVMGSFLLLLGILYNILYPVLRLEPVKWILITIYIIPICVIIVKAIQTIVVERRDQTGTEGADALIVLGLITRNDKISTELKYRVDKAYSYLCKNPGTIAILSGGIDSGETRSEADIMYEYFTTLGIDCSRLIKEEQATSTVENFKYSMEIINERLPKTARVVFVTTNYHVRRAENTARKYGYPISGIASKGVWFKLPNDFMREFIVWVKLKMDGVL